MAALNSVCIWWDPFKISLNFVENVLFMVILTLDSGSAACISLCMAISYVIKPSCAFVCLCNPRLRSTSSSKSTVLIALEALWLFLVSLSHTLRIDLLLVSIWISRSLHSLAYTMNMSINFVSDSTLCSSFSVLKLNNPSFNSVLVFFSLQAYRFTVFDGEVLRFWSLPIYQTLWFFIIIHQIWH